MNAFWLEESVCMRNGHGPVEQYLASKYANDLNSVGFYPSFLPPSDIQDALSMMAYYDRMSVSGFQNGSSNQKKYASLTVGV
jgi:hypothetical protein